MSAASDIDPKTRATQANASDPSASAWVSANAGSGKTYVLARRVIRLLLAGVDPVRILCLTFTKAAAAEMANRVFAILGSWTTLSDEKLAEELADLEGAAPNADLMAAARRLFARALDTPGGLKIQTIHAFCERLLHQFPFEANVAGHFEVLEERAAQALSDQAQRSVLARAAEDEGSGLGRALKTVLSLVSDVTHRDSVAEFVAQRDKLRAWIDARGNLDAAIADLHRELGVGRDESSESVRRAILAGVPLDGTEARRLFDLLLSGSPSDQKAAEQLAPYLSMQDEASRLAAWIGLFFKDDGDPRRNPITRGTLGRWPGLDARIAAETARLAALLERLRTTDLFESSAAMLRLADAAIAEYNRLKQRRGVLDFEDLVVRSVALLARSDAARWVQYKLDRGLDHILVDEAQDTSPRQWQVVKALVEDFFAGEGASPKLRTLFAVGDEKQSIFSFQGAVPAWFSAVQKELAARAKGAALAWHDLELHLSFRSVPVVLAAVDAVFADPEVHRGLSAEMQSTEHTARRRNQPGCVVVWPRLTQPDKPQADDWVKPLDYLGAESPEVRLAERLAETIGGWLSRHEVLDAPDEKGQKRPIRAGGILILTRTRGALTDAINRALKTRHIPIAGADRLTLTEHIAVMDLMALGRVVLLPEDDLSLAALLRSPLIGMSEEGLFDLACGQRRTLWGALKRRAAERAEFARAYDRISGWRALADKLDPHALYARILGPDGGRRALLDRLGPEAEDVLDEFVAQTLAYEQADVPTLEGFLDWLMAGETEIKRDSEMRRDEVRVMTVHGAKGLEADIVFLIDNGTDPAIAGHDPRLLPLADEFNPEHPCAFVWMRSIRWMPAPIEARVQRWRERSREEYRRLLYVGMTRAKDRLYVAGISKTTRNDDRRWHPLVTRALEAGWREVRRADGAVTEYEWRPVERAAATAEQQLPEARVTEVPDWARRPVGAPPERRRLTPSGLGRFDEDARSLPRAVAARIAAAAEAAAVRGRLVHRLLESLPALPPDHRAAVGAAYLGAFANEMDDEARRALLGEVLAVMANPVFAPVFAPGSRAEVDIAGRITMADGEAEVSGRIDRLAVTADRVLVVDFKTNRPAPKTPDEVPDGYVAQLALYRLLLARLYPRCRIAAALLWTDTATLMELPAEMLAEAEARVLGDRGGRAGAV